MLYITFQYGWEPVLIKQILIGFEAILYWKLILTIMNELAPIIIIKILQIWLSTTVNNLMIQLQWVRHSVRRVGINSPSPTSAFSNESSEKVKRIGSFNIMLWKRGGELLFAVSPLVPVAANKPHPPHTPSLFKCNKNRYIITWMLHQIFMYYDKVILAAG